MVPKPAGREDATLVAVATVWDDPEWISSELHRIASQGERWGFTDIQIDYWAQLQARAAELDAWPPGGEDRPR